MVCSRLCIVEPAQHLGGDRGCVFKGILGGAGKAPHYRTDIGGFRLRGAPPCRSGCCSIQAEDMWLHIVDLSNTRRPQGNSRERRLVSDVKKIVAFRYEGCSRTARVDTTGVWDKHGEVLTLKEYDGQDPSSLPLPVFVLIEAVVMPLLPVTIPFRIRG